MLHVDTAWFNDRLAENRISQRQLAKKIGLDSAAISLTFRGKRRMKLEEAAQISRLLGVSSTDVLRAAGLGNDGKTVPLWSYMDGNGEFHVDTSGNPPRVPAPDGLPPECGAAQARTAGSPLEYLDGCIMYCAKPVTPSPEHYGKLAGIICKNGLKVFGSIRRGYLPNTYNISGPTVSLESVEVSDIFPILQIHSN